METNNLLSELFTLLFNNLYLNIFISAMCVASYVFNIVILRLRKQYLPLNNKMIIFFLVCPLMNISFLALNVIIMCINIRGYAIRKRRLTKSTYKYHQEKVARSKRKKVAGAS